MAVVADPRDAFDAEFGGLFAELSRLGRALGAGGSSDDIAQEALIEGRRQLEQLRDPAKLRPWLRTMVARKASRRRSARWSALEQEPVYLPVDPIPGSTRPPRSPDCQSASGRRSCWFTAWGTARTRPQR